MSQASAAINSLNSVLKSISYGDRTAYVRIVTRTGGDDLIGRPGRVSYTDAVLDPPPVWTRLGEFMLGPRAHSEALRKGSFRSVADSYMFIISPSAVSLATLQDKEVVIVLKDSELNEEVYRITDLEPISIGGTDIVLLAYVESTSRE